MQLMAIKKLCQTSSRENSLFANEILDDRVFNFFY
ncbi:hypothetical protein SAMN06296036_11330 [Pseudobacteriovorax antillogorgiicola]|uniref:Uncharacterized protein n=1 Tax=Pseudobacteriovorax antillogorgiicola TaxID=1513793 RepID=A0A1Y6C581_9BACT|nr:hypothetical protein EDD56_11431 [Pseudobacteriovorax antillogorgiicola]SMF42913.1 hypothetical protein SAMN06296036_11330 [Pseudobacteriovorax antillogorgiicola]